MEGEGQVVTAGTLDESQTNLNDLQSYLVHFNKEIEVTGEGPFHHNVSQIITQTSQPVFVTVPVSSESSTPDEEQLPVISDIKVSKESEPEVMITADITSDQDDDTDSGENVLQMEGIAPAAATQGAGEVTGGQVVTVEELPQSVRLQELTLENLTGATAQQAFAVSDGMVMLPMGDASSILSQTDSRLVQIVNINGQPTLQVVGDASMLQPDGAQGETVVQPVTMVPQPVASSQPTSVDGVPTDPVAVLASVAANTNTINQLQTIQLSQQDIAAAQLVAVRTSVESSVPQVVAMKMEGGGVASMAGGGAINPMQLLSSLDGVPMASMLNSGTGYQSVAIVPSGDSGQTSDVNYVLIVNQTDKDNMQGPVYDFGDDIRGEVIEELTEDDGTTKRLVKINQLLSKKHLEATITAIPVGDQLMCSYCSYTSPKRYLLSRHMKSHSEDRPHKCSLCERGFKTMASLQNHINTHTGIRPHKCKLCESAFTTSGELVRHIRYKHTFEKPHKCKECDYASVELSKLKRHMRSHTGERPYACAHCNYASPDTYKLKRHMRIHTGEKPYQCDICQAKFTQSNSLKAHKLIHSGNKPVFQCSMCPTTCGRKTDLKIHMQKLHTSDQPLTCKRCGQSFPDRYTFKLHTKSHEGEKCFKCTECDYAAVSHRHLETHMLTHTGMKPFECEDCDLAFRQKQLLKRHRNLYHNPDYTPPDPKDKEHECKECEKAFVHRGNLMRHMQNSHEDMDGSSAAGMESQDKKTIGFHTCGGCPKSVVEGIQPLTADQLIENSLLADMKEGKLGASPKVVVVHPDGRLEEVTAKLQSLSQSKPVDDFLVSLGVTGDPQFDQVTDLPSDVVVSEEDGVATVSIAAGTVSTDCTGIAADTGDSRVHVVAPKVTGLTFEVGDTTMGTIQAGLVELDQTKEESTQASFDSDDDENKKLKLMSQEQLLRLTQTNGTADDCGFKITSVDRPLDNSIQQIMVSVLQCDIPKEIKRELDDDDDVDVASPTKRLRIDLDTNTEL